MGTPVTDPFKIQRRHPLAECEKCPLFDPDCTFVPSDIPANPEIMVVGEAPGREEAEKKKPFMGASGRLIKLVLKRYGYKPSQVGFTNACLCRPPGNATPPKAAVAACSGRLVAELAKSRVRSVLALGGTAAEVCVDDPRKITALRAGPGKEPSVLLASAGVEVVVPTWHPAYCLRNADAFPALVGDVAKLRESRRVPWSAPEFNVLDDVDTAISVLDWLTANAPVCVVDIEVGIDKDESFGHPNTYSLLCVGLGVERGKALVLAEGVLQVQEVRDALRRFLLTTRIIAHNGKFDLQGLYPTLGPLELWFDTMLAHYTLDERPGTHGLKLLAIEQLGAPEYDREIKVYVPKRGNYADIPRPILYKYNAYDVACTWDLYELFEAKMARDELRPLHDHLVAASNQLMYLELNGIAIDRAYSQHIASTYQTRLSGLVNELGRLVGSESFNPRSPKQVKEFLHEHGIITASTDVDHLTALLNQNRTPSTVRDFVKSLLVYRRQQKLYSTYIEGIRARMYRGRVYTTYLLHGTTSGRLASRNPNLQNIVRDKEIRRQFSVSDPSHVLIQADYKQAEGRVIATLAQDEYLRKIFSDPNIDMFNELSDSLYGKGNWAKEERVRTKAFFYGLSYGRQAVSIAAEYGMSVAEAEKRLREFMDLIPATAVWQAATKRMVLSGADLITPFGRHRRFHLITLENQRDVLNEALSYLPQSTASDICLRALIRLRPMLRGLGWIRLTIHDALVVECPQQNRDRVVDLLKQVMEEEGRRFTDYVPFVVDVSEGKNWGDL